MWYSSPRISLLDRHQNQQRHKWLEDNLKSGTWGYVSGLDKTTYRFQNKEDLTWFMMLWYNE